MFYKVTLVCICIFLLVLCFEIIHIENVIAQSYSTQRIAICDGTGFKCASIECDSNNSNNPAVNLTENCYLLVKE